MNNLDPAIHVPGTKSCYCANNTHDLQSVHDYGYAYSEIMYNLGGVYMIPDRVSFRYDFPVPY